MVEIPVPNFQKDIERVESQGEKIPKVEKKYKSSAKSVRGLILGLKSKFENDIKTNSNITYSAREMIEIFNEALRRHNEVESVAKVKLRYWKGKSGIIQLIKQPDKIIAIRMQKPDKDEKPEEKKIEMSKEQINAVIEALNILKDKQPIETREIAMIYSRKLNLGHPDWDRFFSDRTEHNLLTNILDVLDNEGLIHYYRSGKTKILKDKLDIQEILK